MNCPLHTDTALVITERSGIEIDYCPTCRGVWLDRGELDKLIERAADATVVAAGGRREPGGLADDHGEGSQDWDDDRDDDDRGRGRPKRRKRESFLSEFFDFG